MSTTSASVSASSAAGFVPVINVCPAPATSTASVAALPGTGSASPTSRTSGLRSQASTWNLLKNPAPSTMTRNAAMPQNTVRLDAISAKPQDRGIWTGQHGTGYTFLHRYPRPGGRKMSKHHNVTIRQPHRSVRQQTIVDLDLPGLQCLHRLRDNLSTQVYPAASLVFLAPDEARLRQRSVQLPSRPCWA